MAHNIVKIKEDIEFIEDLLKDGSLTDTERKDAEDELDAKKVELAEAEGAGAAKSAKEPKSAKEKAQKAPKATPVKKAKPTKEPKPSKAKKAKAPKGETIIIVDGKEYDLDDCKQAIGALKARKVQAKKIAKKFKSKKAGSKIADGIEKIMTQADKAITEKAESNPEKLVGVYKEIKKTWRELLALYAKVMSKEDSDALKSALGIIDELTEKYKNKIE